MRPSEFLQLPPEERSRALAEAAQEAAQDYVRELAWLDGVTLEQLDAALAPLGRWVDATRSVGSVVLCRRPQESSAQPPGAGQPAGAIAESAVAPEPGSVLPWCEGRR